MFTESTQSQCTVNIHQELSIIDVMNIQSFLVFQISFVVLRGWVSKISISFDVWVNNKIILHRTEKLLVRNRLDKLKNENRIKRLFKNCQAYFFFVNP